MSLSNPDPVFVELVSNLGAELKSVVSSGDHAIIRAKRLAQSIMDLDMIMAELGVSLESDTRESLNTLNREIRYCIAYLEDAVRDTRNDTIAFERKNIGVTLPPKFIQL